MTAAQPWMKFFPTDWRGDQALRICSLEARGLWIECLCLMHEAEPYGYLTINGRALDASHLAKLTGMAEARIDDLMGELEAAGVFSRNRQGTVFSRRMIRDARRLRAARANGKKGGNPKLAAAKQVSDGDDRTALKTQSPEAEIPEPQTPQTKSPQEEGPPPFCDDGLAGLGALADDPGFRDWAKAAAPNADLKLEIEKFCDHSRANGRRWADPRAGLKAWLRRAQSFAEKDGRAETEPPPLSPAERWMAVKALMRKDVRNVKTFREVIAPLEAVGYAPLTLSGPPPDAAIADKLRARWGADVVFAGTQDKPVENG